MIVPCINFTCLFHLIPLELYSENHQSCVKMVYNFFSLPRELRDQIYGELFVHPEDVFICQPERHRSAFSRPSFPMVFSRANRQIHNEIMDMFCTSNSFVLELNVSSAIDFLRAMPWETTRRFSRMTWGRTLMTDGAITPQTKKDLVFTLRSFLNLRTLSIMVPDEKPTTTGIFVKWIPPPTYSWTLVGRVLDSLQDLPLDQIQLNWNHRLPTEMYVSPEKLLGLHAFTRILQPESYDRVFRIERTRTDDGKHRYEGKGIPGKYTIAFRRHRLFVVAIDTACRSEDRSLVSIARVKKRAQGGLYIC